ncbi:sodium:neurotransmitter symporter family protein [bacterium BMS3Abin07]|nr:sodium:neurotransmitter symporter family protein [bacterium BMS3Abin07]GBE32667.1 sodium:neurotransmitter symporter family protein [bacterium BMS3Bbin05]HDO23314.1 sodium-dependent transporter [Nitrospirota bacterium]
MADKRSQWKSETGFVLAAVGSAIGLGNIWRFSYMAYENGGGAFLIPYLVALLTAGIPLLLLEFAIGHERIGSAPLAYSKINKNWEWLGWWAVTFVMFGIVLYYVVIIAWCLNFFLLSFNLGWGGDPNNYFFKKFLMVSKGPSAIGEIRTRIFFAVAFIWVLNWIIVYRGVEKGIEIANRVFMPLLFILTAVLVFWALSLKGAGEGIKAYLTPDFSKITKPKVWIDAYSQIFFTLSLGFGIMIAYASYLPEKSNISRNAYIIAFLNSGYSIFAGFATFSILGYMASAQGVKISEVVSQSIGLAFVAYPKAMSLIPGGSIFGAIFFFCLVVAGLSSSISIIEAFISAMVDKFGYRRKPLITAVSVLGFMGSVIFTTNGGLYWLDIVDHFLTHYGLVIVGIFECILVGWFFKLEVIRRHINRISSIKVGVLWSFLIRYFVPVILIIILLGDLYNEISKPYGGYTWTSLILIGRDWVLATLAAAFVFASRPWRTEKRNEKNRESIV